ncbi:hypothetical protein [Streptomyces sp. P8-A8]|uniref:LexA family protein n=1 Tax=unclassified Streptomyces TaxID=2593676 RepID=UPI0036D943F3
MTRPDALSSRQEAILATIRDWIVETGESPSVRQIGERVASSDGDSRKPDSAASSPGSRADPGPGRTASATRLRAVTPASCPGYGTPTPGCGDDAGHRPLSGAHDVLHPVAMHDIGRNPPPVSTGWLPRATHASEDRRRRTRQPLRRRQPPRPGGK